MDQSHPLMQSELAELLPAKFLAEAEIALTEKGKRPDVAMLEAWCKGEKLTRKGGNAIGIAC